MKINEAGISHSGADNNATKSEGKKKMNKRWIAKNAPDEEVFQKLKNELKTSDILLKLIAQRNISSLQEAHSYFVPTLDALHAPFLMKNMDRAVDRISKAISGNEKIVIYGDYDVDGTTAVALVYSFFRKLHSNIDYYIPDRFKEGYGISQTGIDWANGQGATLIIALDCGIKSVDLVQYATGKQIDFIICDHHTPGDTVPDAVAVLNPKQKDCGYPYKELSGCGIGFKLVQAYAGHFNISWSAEEYMDLVAISISADIVHMTGENRILTYFGLKKINTDPRPGVKALIGISSLKNDLNVNDLVFRIGPRINAAGRITNGMLAVKVLIEENEDKAVEIASTVNQNNTDRQGVDQTITKQALEMIEQMNGHDHRKTTVLFNKDWHKGVIGIVASRLIEKYYRPTILLTESNGYAVGSARSVPGFDLYEAIKQCDPLLEQWGGHQAAAGLTMPLENVDAFRARFEEAVQQTITDELLTPVLEYDMELDLDDITQTFCRSIERFGPFGPENMKPVFISREVYVIDNPRIVGNNHLQLVFRSDNGNILKGIGFGLGDYQEHISRSKPLNICYTVEPNIYRGVYSISLNLKDIQIA